MPNLVKNHSTKPAKQFLEKVFAINASYTGLGGLNSPTSSYPASQSSGGDVVDRLRHAAVTYATLLDDPKAEQSAIAVAAQAVEGKLLTLQALGQISNGSTDTLITELYDLQDNLKSR